MIKKLVSLFLFINIVFGCTKDDICTGETLTTPKLIITFKSKINPNISKTVADLTVTTIVENDTITIINSVTTDSIAIPLQTGFDFTNFQFIKDNTTSNDGNQDLVNFSYQREFVYVNRACAFKTYFTNLISEFVIEENENWIQEMSVINSNVENENETHVIIYH